MDRRELERAAGAVIMPEVRAAGTRPKQASHADVRPDGGYLRRHPPAGVVVFGRAGDGPRDPRALLAGVRADLEASGEPTCFAACDLEQGAGLHFDAATRLPPALALAAAAAGARGGPERGLAWIRAAGALTAREARELGVELVLAPAADVNTTGANPIIAVRSFGDDPARAAACACAFHAGLQEGGAGGCAKHFPGHGDVTTDSHAVLPEVARSLDQLERVELVPFRALIDAGVASVMVGHLDVPALTREPGLPATLSRVALEEVLRARLGFAGAVLSDAMDMGALTGFPQPHARALAAGCDGILCPSDPSAAAAELVAAVEQGRVPLERLTSAAGRMRELRDGLRAAEPPTGAPDGDEAASRGRFAAQVAEASLCLSTRRWAWKRGRPCEVLAPLHQAHGQEARATLERLRRALAGSPRPAGVLLPVLGELQAGSGRYGPGPAELAEVEGKVASLRALGWAVGLLWLGSPQTLPAAWWGRPELPILVAFAPTPPMVEAAARWLMGRSEAGGCLPCALG